MVLLVISAENEILLETIQTSTLFRWLNSDNSDFILSALELSALFELVNHLNTLLKKYLEVEGVKPNTIGDHLMNTFID